MKKKCIICNEEFFLNRVNKICCSSACSGIRKKKTKIDWNLKNIELIKEYRSRRKKDNHTICPICSVLFAKNSGSQKFCSKKCFSEHKKEYSKEYKKKHLIPKEKIEGVCKVCCNTYKKTKSNQKVCSKICRKELTKQLYRKYLENNRDKVNERSREWCKNNTEKYKISLKKRQKKWRSKECNKKRIRELARIWRENNKEKIKEYDRKKNKEARKDSKKRIFKNVRERVAVVVNTYKKTGRIPKERKQSITKNIGCTKDYLIKHLEKQFIDGMSWNNYGLNGWHVDHIIPLSSFDLTNEEEFKKACHYTNLQPLWAKDNLSKGKKILSQEPLVTK